MSNYTKPTTPEDQTSSGSKAPDMVIANQSIFRRQLIVAGSTVAIPVIWFLVGISLPFFINIPWYFVLIWATMHYLGMIGISVGFHRLASHSSFKGTTFVKAMLLIFGSMSAQGPVIYWVSNHRRHHHKADKEGDVHSPYFTEDGHKFKRKLWGLLHAHTGWMYRSNPSNPLRYASGLFKESYVVFVNKNYYIWILLGVVIPGFFALAIEFTFMNFFLGALYGGVVRLFTVQHATWSINSLTHMIGKRPYKRGGEATNLAILSLITAGESWHNNHHSFPSSARLGLHWWQFDPGYITLKILEKLRLVWDIKIPHKKQIAITDN